MKALALVSLSYMSFEFAKDAKVAWPGANSFFTALALVLFFAALVVVII